MNKIDGRRQSAAECYLSAKVRARPNLSVSGGVLVRRILFNNNRVEGVEVEVAGQVQCIRTEQVVLCAGAIQSPGILLRSGVGPAADLARLQVSTVARVEGVGRRLLDHPGAVIVLAPRPGVSSIHHPLIQTTLRFTSQGSECPNDMQLQPGSLITLPLARIPAVTLMVCVGKPRGTGTLTFRSADAQVSPKIESRLLEHPADRARVAEALQLAWLTASTPVLSDMASFLWPSERVLRDKQDLLRWLPASTGSGYHPCGTIPMGPDAGPDACVDQYGRLRGVDGVVVADASIMPTIPSSNTNFPTLMIGERVGEWLRDGAL